MLDLQLLSLLCNDRNKKRFQPVNFFKVTCYPYYIHTLHKLHVRMCKNAFYLTKRKSQFVFKPKSKQQKLRRGNKDGQTLVHAISKLQVFEKSRAPFFCLTSLLSNKAGACSFLSLAILLPQNQMNAMVRHAGGKHQACIIFAIKAIEP